MSTETHDSHLHSSRSRRRLFLHQRPSMKSIRTMDLSQCSHTSANPTGRLSAMSMPNHHFRCVTLARHASETLRNRLVKASVSPCGLFVVPRLSERGHFHSNQHRGGSTQDVRHMIVLLTHSLREHGSELYIFLNLTQIWFSPRRSGARWHIIA